MQIYIGCNPPLNFGGFLVHSDMLKKIVNLIFEGQMLKRKKREGRRLIGVQFPESVAEHCLNAAQLGYILAKMENANVSRVVEILIRHDLGEARIGDVDKVMARYLPNKKEGEIRAFQEQIDGLPFEKDLSEIYDEYNAKETLEAKIAKDADYLECAFQAKQYVENGYIGARNWIENVGGALQTESAKKIREEMQQSSFTDWRQGLKKLD